MSDPQPKIPVPWWFTLLAVLSALPALRLPALISRSVSEATVLLWLYPVICVLGAILAWIFYSRDNRTVAWILLFVVWLCNLSIDLVI